MSLSEKNQMTVTIASFGYPHSEPPPADLLGDLRRHFRDPHVSPELRHLTAHDDAVRRAVMATDGIPALVAALAAATDAYLAGPSAGGHVSVAVGCAGGRHRAATVALALAAVLSGDQEQAATLGLAAPARQFAGRSITVDVLHRDLDKLVVQR